MKYELTKDQFIRLLNLIGQTQGILSRFKLFSSIEAKWDALVRELLGLK